MSSIKRRGKRSYSKNELLYEVMEALGINPVPKNRCPLPRLPDFMPVDFCINICYNPCEGFMNFDFIFSKCFSEGCSSESPCAECIREVEKHKVFFRCLKALDMDEVDRYRSYNHQIEKYIKKHGLKNEDE
jgi:hypothetical protein